MIGVGIIGRAQEPVIEPLEMRQRPRDLRDLARDVANLLGDREQQLRAKTVRCEWYPRGLVDGRGRRWLRRGIGDGAQRLDDLGALGVILQRVQCPPCLFRRQRMGVGGGRRGRRGVGLGESRRCEEHPSEKNRDNEFLQHANLIFIVSRESQTGIGFPHGVMPGRPLSPRPFVGSLLIERQCFGNCRMARGRPIVERADDEEKAGNAQQADPLVEETTQETAGDRAT